MAPAIVLACLLLAGGAHAQAPSVIPMLEHHDAAGFSIDHPDGWTLRRPGGTRKLVIGRHAGDHLLLCNIDEAPNRPPLAQSQRQLDEQLLQGFRTEAWPRQLAGARTVLAFEVRGVGDVPMGIIEWEALEGAPRASFARGLKVFRFTPGATWSAECAVISETKFLADAYFRANADLLGRILGSVRFPEGG